MKYKKEENLLNEMYRCAVSRKVISSIFCFRFSLYSNISCLSFCWDIFRWNVFQTDSYTTVP